MSQALLSGELMGASHRSPQSKRKRPSFGRGYASVRKLKQVLTILVGGTLLGALLLFGSALLVFRQLETAFLEQQDLHPIQIFSDLSELSLDTNRDQIEDILQALRYDWRETPEKSLQFRLRRADFPVELLPEHQKAFASQEPEVEFRFSNEDAPEFPTELLINGQAAPSVHLEPELVATLTDLEDSGSSSAPAKKQIRRYLKFDQIPHRMKMAVMAVEDSHFLDHPGLDWRGIARALWVNLTHFSFKQGGSTITQQLVKNLRERHTKNLLLKLNEIVLALALEARFTKEEILERYLNEIYLGQVGAIEIHGIAQGAEYFFEKRPEQLTLNETAFLAGVIRGPSFYSPYRHRERAIERQRFVLKRMHEAGFISESELVETLQSPLSFAPPQSFSNRAPYFVDFIKGQLKEKLSDPSTRERGLKVYSTLNLRENLLAQKSVEAQVIQIEKKLPEPTSPELRLEGAFVSVDPRTGFLKAIVGGRNYAVSSYNRAWTMRRQVGSTLKPLVYLSVFLAKKDADGIPYSPAYPVFDGPWTLKYDSGRQTWSPKNFEKKYRGWISFREAMAHSVNTVAAKIAVRVGLDQVVRTARDAGIDSPLSPVPSLALGTAELSPLEILEFYSVLANHGEFDSLTAIRRVTDTQDHTLLKWDPQTEQKIDADAADLVTSLLSSVFAEGTAASAAKLGWTRPSAGKTGTTNHHRDAWFAGYTSERAAVSWLGWDQLKNEAKGPTLQLTGGGYALPIWVSALKPVLDRLRPQAWHPRNEGWAPVRIDLHSGAPAESGCPDSQTREELLPPEWMAGVTPSCRAAPAPEAVIEKSE